MSRNFADIFAPMPVSTRFSFPTLLWVLCRTSLRRRATHTHPTAHEIPGPLASMILSKSGPRQDFVYRAVGVRFSFGHRRRDGVELFFTKIFSCHALHQARFQQLQNPFFPVGDFACPAFVRLLEMLAE